MSKNMIGYFTFLIAIFSLLSACSSNESSDLKSKAKEDFDVTNSEHAYHAENGDLRELTTSASTIPSFLTNKPEHMQNIYLAAARHEHILEYIPCYCGCADSGNHQDVLDCFVHDKADNGTIVWDDHGTRCGVCLETAAESIIQFQDGNSIREIREYIDEKYNEGYSRPTPTKLPKEI